MLFQRNCIWQARIKPEKGPYIWRSLRTSSIDKAKDAAKRLYYRIELQVEQGLPIQRRTFTAVMDEYEKRGEQYLLIKSPPASGKSRALMFIALDKLQNQGLRQAIIVVPERSIGASFADEPLTKYGFWADWTVAPQWNLCNAPGADGGKVNAVGTFLASADKVLVCTHATFRFAVEKFGVAAVLHADERTLSKIRLNKHGATSSLRVA